MLFKLHANSDFTKDVQRLEANEKAKQLLESAGDPLLVNRVQGLISLQTTIAWSCESTVEKGRFEAK